MTEEIKVIDEYIAAQSEQAQPYLRQVRESLRAVLPDAQEKISWRMPTYWQGRNIIHFAAFKNHLGIYPGSEAVAQFADRLQDYQTSKGAIQFPYSRPLPLDLIADIAHWCYQASNRD